MSVDVVVCNCAPESAVRLADALITRGLAACVDVLPNGVSWCDFRASVREPSSVLLIYTASVWTEATCDSLEAEFEWAKPVFAVPAFDIASERFVVEVFDRLEAEYTEDDDPT